MAECCHSVPLTGHHGLCAQVVGTKRELAFSRAELMSAFRRFAGRGAPPGCIAPEALEKALVSTKLLPCLACSVRRARGRKTSNV
jgi:hypothetical protein